MGFAVHSCISDMSLTIARGFAGLCFVQRYSRRKAGGMFHHTGSASRAEAIWA